MRYRRSRSAEIEARLFDPIADYDGACEIIGWCGGRITDEGCEIRTPEGTRSVYPGDYVIRDVEGAFRRCPQHVFEVTYEPVPGWHEAVVLPVSDEGAQRLAAALWSLAGAIPSRSQTDTARAVLNRLQGSEH